MLRPKSLAICGRGCKATKATRQDGKNLLVFPETQEGCGRFRRENPGAFPKAGPIFRMMMMMMIMMMVMMMMMMMLIILGGKCPNLDRDCIRCCRKSVKNFSSASKFAGKLYQQGISDSHSLLEFSECSVLGLA